MISVLEGLDGIRKPFEYAYLTCLNAVQAILYGCGIQNGFIPSFARFEPVSGHALLYSTPTTASSATGPG